MQGVTSGSNTTMDSQLPQAIPRLPPDVIVEIAKFCGKREGYILYSMGSSEYRTTLLEKIRHAQIVLVRGVGERLEKGGILDDGMQKIVRDKRVEALEEIAKARRLDLVVSPGVVFAETLNRVEREHRVWMHPFSNWINGEIDREHQFIPSDLENRVCKAVVSASHGLFLDRTRLEEAVRLMREGKADQTEESSKAEKEGKNCLLAGLARTIFCSSPTDWPFFFEIVTKITETEIRDQVLSFCLDRLHSSSLKRNEFLGHFRGGYFFPLLSTNMRLRLVKEIGRSDPQEVIRIASRCSDLEVKKEALLSEIYGDTFCKVISTQPERLFLILDVARSIPQEEREKIRCPIFPLLDRLEKICQGHRSDFASFNAAWERAFRRIYQDVVVNGLTGGALRILIADEGWGREPTPKMVADSWEVIRHFSSLRDGFALYMLLIHACSYIQDRESFEEVAKIIFQKLNGIKHIRKIDAEREAFIGYLLLRGLDHLKDKEFVNYEYLIDQIKGTIRKMVNYRRGLQEDLVIRIGGLNFIAITEGTHRGFYTKFYVLAGALQEAFPSGEKKDQQIMKLYELYNGYNMKEDPMAKKLMSELVEQIESEETRRVISWTP